MKIHPILAGLAAAAAVILTVAAVTLVMTSCNTDHDYLQHRS